MDLNSCFYDSYFCLYGYFALAIQFFVQLQSICNKRKLLWSLEYVLVTQSIVCFPIVPDLIFLVSRIYSPFASFTEIYIIYRYTCYVIFIKASYSCVCCMCVGVYCVLVHIRIAKIYLLFSFFKLNCTLTKVEGSQGDDWKRSVQYIT